jgi:hypothetical protein
MSDKKDNKASQTKTELNISNQSEIDMFLKQGPVSSKSEIEAFLDKSTIGKKSSYSESKGRLIFGMDATASREASWDRACHLQGEMFQETLGLGGLEVQLAYYKGFGQFNATPWISKPNELLEEMTKVRCVGGQTQIEKVLNHAIKETSIKRVQALVFIGDSFEEDIDSICHSAGKLGMLGVRAFCFQEGNDPIAKSGLQQIARLTNGAYSSFDASSANQLKELLKAVAVYAAGGLKQLKKHSTMDKNVSLKLTDQMK